jgi:GTP-binding protein EngB required for normal cell division
MGNIIRTFWQKISLSQPSTKQLKSEALKHFNIDKTIFNIVVIGKAFTGKTSFIEAIAGEDSKCEVLEDVNKYKTPKLPNILFWEMPQFTQTKEEIPAYYKQNLLFSFDLIIIVCQPTLGEEELELIKLAKSHDQDVILVRSKCDDDLDNQKKRRAIAEINQDAADNHLFDLQTKFESALLRNGFSNVMMYFISAITLRDLAEGIQPELQFQERELMKFVQTAQQSKKF